MQRRHLGVAQSKEREGLFFTYELQNYLDDNSKMFLTTLQLLSETTNWIEEYCKLNR